MEVQSDAMSTGNTDDEKESCDMEEQEQQGDQDEDGPRGEVQSDAMSSAKTEDEKESCDMEEQPHDGRSGSDDIEAAPCHILIDSGSVCMFGI